MDALKSIPCRVIVASIVSGRYGCESVGSLPRPNSWDLRESGFDTITTEDGKTIKLFSDGQQPTPVPGWKLMITGGSVDSGYTWTLYGMPRAATAPCA